MLKWIKTNTANVTVEDVMNRVILVGCAVACIIGTIVVVKTAYDSITGTLELGSTPNVGDGNWLSATAVSLCDITMDNMDRVIGIANETGEIISYALLDQM